MLIFWSGQSDYRFRFRFTAFQLFFLVPTPEPIIEIKKEKPVERGKATKTTHI